MHSSCNNNSHRPLRGKGGAAKGALTARRTPEAAASAGEGMNHNRPMGGDVWGGGGAGCRRQVGQRLMS